VDDNDFPGVEISIAEGVEEMVREYLIVFVLDLTSRWDKDAGGPGSSKVVVALMQRATVLV